MARPSVVNRRLEAPALRKLPFAEERLEAIDRVLEAVFDLQENTLSRYRNPTSSSLPRLPHSQKLSPPRRQARQRC